MALKVVKRQAKRITDPKDIEYLLAITEDECTKLSFAMDMFGEFNDTRRFQPYDLVDIPVGSYGPEGNKNTNIINVKNIFFFIPAEYLILDSSDIF